MTDSTWTARLRDAVRLRPSHPAELAAFYRFLGRTGFVLGGLGLLLWLSSRGNAEGHGGVWGFIAALYLLPMAGAFWLAGLALTRMARPSWLYEWAPVVGAVVWSATFPRLLGLV